MFQCFMIATKTHLFVKLLRLNFSNMINPFMSIGVYFSALHPSVAIGVVLVPEMMCLLSASYLRKHKS